MNLVRLGHYFIPGHTDPQMVHGSCQTALVVHVWNDEMVNLAVWDSSGYTAPHTHVPTVLPSNDDHNASFHLSSECPWNR